MENREILIANTRTQKRSKITTAATTLGELKSALDNAGIDYSGMTFTEGISKTQLLDDATQLPQNVMYKGLPTNNLVILLTNTKKNIASGICAASRKDCYDIIKENCLQEDIKEYFGRNFTQVPTSDLQQFIEERTDFPSDVDVTPDDGAKSQNTDKETYKVPYCASPAPNLRTQYLFDFIWSLVTTDIIGLDDIKYLIDSLASIADKIGKAPSESASVSTSDGNITDDDIDNMLDDLDM